MYDAAAELSGACVVDINVQRAKVAAQVCESLNVGFGKRTFNGEGLSNGDLAESPVSSLRNRCAHRSGSFTLAAFSPAFPGYPKRIASIRFRLRQMTLGIPA